MKTIVEKHTERRDSAWKDSTDVDVEVLEIEASDIGRTRDHYLGFRHKTVVFGSHHLGARIEVLSGGRHRCSESHNGCPWTCWSFLSMATA